MSLNHLRAQIKSIFCKSPIWAEHYTSWIDHSKNHVSLNSPVFGSQLFENCRELELTRVIDLICQSIKLSSRANSLLRKFPTPYLMYGEHINVNNNTHIALCVKAVDKCSCTEYIRGFGRLCFSRLVFDRDEFHEFEKLYGTSFLKKRITLKSVPEVVHLKNVIRLEGKHQKQQFNDAKGIAKYVYRLASQKPGVKIKLNDFKKELSDYPYNVSVPVAAASWHGLPSEIKHHHRPKGGDPLE